MKAIQLVRARILYPALVRGDNQPYGVIGRSQPMVKDMTKKELRQEIRKLFSDGQTLYYSDIAEQLDVDLKSVVDICRELQENGEIGVDASALARAH